GLFRLVAARQFRMVGRLWPALRPNPCGFRQPEAHAEGVVQFPGRDREAAGVTLPFSAHSRASGNPATISSLRAKRSNPSSVEVLDCLVAALLALTMRVPSLGRRLRGDERLNSFHLQCRSRAAALIALRIAARSSLSALRTDCCAPISPISRWRLTIA